MAHVSDKAAGRVLLPSDVEPKKYCIELEPDLEKFTYEGNVTIEVDVVTETNSITVHSKDLSVHEVTFTSSASGSAVLSVKTMTFDLKHHTLAMVFSEVLPTGAGNLYLKFSGTLNNQMAGFYRSGYLSADGEKRIMASTQFEALDARRCFPCWDEPARKAIFELTMVIPTNRSALSNMPEAEFTLLPNGKTSIRFMPSPLMSTYLLAICVGEFDFIQGVTKHGVSIRIFTPPGKKHLGKFALKVGLETLDLYDDFFEIPYPLPKLDMIAIPDFAMGAMENWGLVTYREVDLLIDEKKASSAQRQRVCTVITHELAHQWFGNLVTMCWWDDLWLNEGFASWMQTYAADSLFPSWSMWEQFTTDDQGQALQLDSLRTSHPIQVPIFHAEEVEEVFDAISYSKGASVVRMLYAVLGNDKFREGLQLYMNRHKYSNTETFHLWNCWEEVSGQPIKKIMSSWTEQMGHPVIYITDSVWDSTEMTMKLTLKQAWFLADGSEASAEESKLWSIPLLYTTDKGAGPGVVMMSSETHELVVSLTSESGWIKLNAGQHTLMRVAYTEKLISALVPAIREKAISPEDRVGLISDAYALTKAGKMGVDHLVILLSAFKNEDNSTVWEALEGVLVGLDQILLDNEAIRTPYSNMVSKLIAPCASSIGWNPKPDDGHLSNLLRGTIVRLLGRFDWKSGPVQEESRKRFFGHCQNPEQGVLPSEYASSVYSIVLKSGGESEYQELMNLLGKLDNIAERKQIFGAIGSVSTIALKKKVLEWAVTEVKLQDFFYPIMSVSGSGKEGRELCWIFFQENFEKLIGMLEKASPSLTNAIITSCCASFADKCKADEIELFFENHPLPNNKRKISQVVEKIRINGAFMERISSSPLASQAFWDSVQL